VSFIGKNAIASSRRLHYPSSPGTEEQQALAWADVVLIRLSSRWCSLITARSFIFNFHPVINQLAIHLS
jgi:hypothetical protein